METSALLAIARETIAKVPFCFAVTLMTPVYLGDRSEPKEIKCLRVTVFSEGH